MKHFSTYTHKRDGRELVKALRTVGVGVDAIGMSQGSVFITTDLGNITMYPGDVIDLQTLEVTGRGNKDSLRKEKLKIAQSDLLDAQRRIQKYSDKGNV